MKKRKYFISYNYYMKDINFSGFDNSHIESEDLNLYENLINLQKQIAETKHYTSVTILFYNLLDNNDYLHNF